MSEPLTLGPLIAALQQPMLTPSFRVSVVSSQGHVFLPITVVRHGDTLLLVCEPEQKILANAVSAAVKRLPGRPRKEKAEDQPQVVRQSSDSLYYTVKDLMAVLQISRSHIYAMERRNEGPPCIQVGLGVRKNRRYLKSEVHDWMKRHEKPVGASYAH